MEGSRHSLAEGHPWRAGAPRSGVARSPDERTRERATRLPGELERACRIGDPANGLWDNSPVARTKRRMGRPVEKRNKLGVWVDDRGWTRQDLALKLGIARGSAIRLCNGLRRPGLDLALKIEALTKGAVPVSYWAATPAHTKD
jgi:DNA-binding XRE family transcriptional regulator